ncbi:hypothetical protein GBAR_LOCUS18514 [Geodia barretti]|uniref:Uncharacterized protein n=1 Tax=Geodia barretti TaxID=519541 RepID=A0AA35WT30_GEOBA|nr:hypothetical protein GBAR_LOCUS18514 [Geodia barretti]
MNYQLLSKNCGRAQAVQPWCRLHVVLLHNVPKSLQWIHDPLVLSLQL